ncbi:MAG: hypothetical protein HY698_20995 [Deltaproteobacteria bacterium]|nr:hypothetical protein [Deltaproteobacteria bacterium]
MLQMARHLLPLLPMRKSLTCLLLIFFGGCEGRMHSTDYLTGGDGGVVPGDGGSAQATARAQFEKEIRPILDSGCAACHVTKGGSGPAFMAPDPDMYTTLKKWPMLVVPGKPNESRLYSFGISPSHSGPEFQPAEAGEVKEWILAEGNTQSEDPDAGSDPLPEPRSGAFFPSQGFNVIDLSALASNIEGATLAFSAEILERGLYLSQLKLTAGEHGLHVVHPLFVAWCPDPEPDPFDRFGAWSLVLSPGASVFLGSGNAALGHFRPGCKLSVEFKEIGSAH